MGVILTAVLWIIFSLNMICLLTYVSDLLIYVTLSQKCNTLYFQGADVNYL